MIFVWHYYLVFYNDAQLPREYSNFILIGFHTLCLETASIFLYISDRHIDKEHFKDYYLTCSK